MHNIVSAHELYAALQALLGLPEHCVSFELRAAAREYGVTVTCEHYVTLDASGLKQLESVLSEYKLLHKPTPATDCPPTDGSELRVVDFDSWMRERTERAHAEYMAGHAAGGIDYSKS